MENGKVIYNNIESSTVQYGAYLDDFYASKGKDPIKAKPKKYKPTRGRKFKQSKVVRKNTVKTPIPKGNSAGIKTLPKKTLGGGGKLAIGLSIAGAVIGGIAIASSSSSNKSKSKKKEKQKVEQIPINNQRLDDSYAMQMAKDISSYRYGKHMTGFVNP